MRMVKPIEVEIRTSPGIECPSCGSVTVRVAQDITTSQPESGPDRRLVVRRRCHCRACNHRWRLVERVTTAGPG